MKASKDHRMPLSKRAMAIVAERLNEGGDFVFPGGRRAEALGKRALLRELERMGRRGVTTHGFRSSFTDWATEETHFPAEVVEMALAHATGSAVRKTYRRRDSLEQRRKLMDQWDRFCSSPPSRARSSR
jgi:integrase